MGMVDREAIRLRWEADGSKRDERGRRLFAASEVRAAGWGGLAAVSSITGLARSTIERGLKEMIRVCQPGGRVAVLEFSMPTNPVLGRMYRSYFRHVLPRLGQLLARNRHSAYNYLPQSVAQFPEGKALAEIMEGCGLTSVQWKPLTCGVATLYHGTKSK